MIRRRILSIVLMILVLSTALFFTGCAEVEKGVSTWEASGEVPNITKQKEATSNIFEFGVYPQSKADASKQSTILGNVGIDATTGLWNVYEEKDESGNVKIRIQYDVTSSYYVYTSYTEDGKQETEKYMLCGEDLYIVEPIKWCLLETDGTDSVLISLNVIDGGKLYSDLYGECTWADSSMRDWLNGTDDYNIENGEKYKESLNFINRAFEDKDISNMKEMKNECSANEIYGTAAGDVANDLVGLLSVAEFNKFFTNEADLNSMAYATPYAIARGASAGTVNEARWWLRDPGLTLYMTGVDRDGHVSMGGFEIQDASVGIRPVIKVATSSLVKAEAETK